MSTIDRVARLAGVSKATVSRVTNMRSNVHPDTVRAVREAMERLQYQPPPKPQRILESENRKLALTAYALVVPELSGDLYPSLLKGFEAAAHQQYHQVIVCSTNNDLFKQGDSILHLIHKKVAGVGIVPVVSGKTVGAHVEVLQDAGIPVVLLHRDVEGVDAPLIALPLEEAGYKAAQTLLERGHRRIALMTGSRSASSELHVSGMRRALEEAQLSLPEQLTRYCEGAAPSNWPELESAVDEAITQMWALPSEQQPTAIYVTFDTIAEVLFMKLMSRGIRVPDRVSIIGFGSSQRSGAITSRLSSIVVDEVAVGRMAVEMLEGSRKARSDRDGSERIVKSAELSLVEGETLGRHRDD